MTVNRLEHARVITLLAGGKRERGREGGREREVQDPVSVVYNAVRRLTMAAVFVVCSRQPLLRHYSRPAPGAPQNDG